MCCCFCTNICPIKSYFLSIADFERRMVRYVRVWFDGTAWVGMAALASGYSHPLAATHQAGGRRLQSMGREPTTFRAMGAICAMAQHVQITVSAGPERMPYMPGRSHTREGRDHGRTGHRGSC